MGDYETQVIILSQERDDNFLVEMWSSTYKQEMNKQMRSGSHTSYEAALLQAKDLVKKYHTYLIDRVEG